MGVVCRCIADIASQKREKDTDDYTLDFDELGKFLPAISVATVIVFSLPSELTQATRIAESAHCNVWESS